MQIHRFKGRYGHSAFFDKNAKTIYVFNQDGKFRFEINGVTRLSKRMGTSPATIRKYIKDRKVFKNQYIFSETRDIIIE